MPPKEHYKRHDGEPAGARDAAFAALRRVSQGAYSSITLGQTLEKYGLSEQDKALASAIFYSTLERETQLDGMIRPLLSRPLSKLENDILIILRMGICQLAFMDKIPGSAAVNESVKLAKKYGYAKASGLVNAVLRAYIRSKGDGPSVEKTAIVIPEQITALWTGDYGEDITEKIVASLAGKPPVYVRINKYKCREDPFAEGKDECELDGVKLRRIDWLPGAAEVLSSGSVESSEAYRNGKIYIQDISSQLCCYLTMLSSPERMQGHMQGRMPERILDACAAPGGKSFTMAQYLDGESVITARDIYPHRVELIDKGAKRLGIGIIRTGVRNALDPDAKGTGGSREISEERAYDAALCDVPCSGLGVIRRKPDILKKSKKEIAALPELQYKILEAAARKVVTGGVLMYSTCTLCRAENGDIIERFLREHKDFEGVPLELPREGLRTIDEPDWSLTLFPHAAGSDGFYMAKLRRISDGG